MSHFLAVNFGEIIFVKGLNWAFRHPTGSVYSRKNTFVTMAPPFCKKKFCQRSASQMARAYLERGKLDGIFGVKKLYLTILGTREGRKGLLG